MVKESENNKLLTNELILFTYTNILKQVKSLLSEPPSLIIDYTKQYKMLDKIKKALEVPKITEKQDFFDINNTLATWNNDIFGIK